MSQLIAAYRGGRDMKITGALEVGAPTDLCVDYIGGGNFEISGMIDLQGLSAATYAKLEVTKNPPDHVGEPPSGIHLVTLQVVDQAGLPMAVEAQIQILLTDETGGVSGAAGARLNEDPGNPGSTVATFLSGLGGPTGPSRLVLLTSAAGVASFEVENLLIPPNFALNDFFLFLTLETGETFAGGAQLYAFQLFQTAV